MAVTRSWTARGPRRTVVAVRKTAPARHAFLWLACASLLVAAGLAMVYAAKVQRWEGAAQAVNVNAVTSPQQLLPLLESIADRSEREAAAQKVFDFPNAPGRCAMPERWRACACCG